MSKGIDINSLIKQYEIIIGEKSYLIKPTKVKYFKNGFYNMHMFFKQIGFVELISLYSDGIELAKKYFTAVFDSEEIAEEIFDSLDTKIVKDIVEKTNILNEIKEQDLKNQQTGRKVE